MHSTAILRSKTFRINGHRLRCQFEYTAGEPFRAPIHVSAKGCPTFSVKKTSEGTFVGYLMDPDLKARTFGHKDPARLFEICVTKFWLPVL